MIIPISPAWVIAVRTLILVSLNLSIFYLSLWEVLWPKELRMNKRIRITQCIRQKINILNCLKKTSCIYLILNACMKYLWNVQMALRNNLDLFLKCSSILVGVIRMYLTFSSKRFFSSSKIKSTNKLAQKLALNWFAIFLWSKTIYSWKHKDYKCFNYFKILQLHSLTKTISAIICEHEHKIVHNLWWQHLISWVL